MRFFNWFRSIPEIFTRVFRVVQQVIPEELLQAAERLVKEYLVKEMDNAAKRELAVQALQRLFPMLPERYVRAAIELAVVLVKRELEMK